MLIWQNYTDFSNSFYLLLTSRIASVNECVRRGGRRFCSTSFLVVAASLISDAVWIDGVLGVMVLVWSRFVFDNRRPPRRNPSPLTVRSKITSPLDVMWRKLPWWYVYPPMSKKQIPFSINPTTPRKNTATGWCIVSWWSMWTSVWTASTNNEKQNAAKKMPTISMVKMSIRVQPNVLRSDRSWRWATTSLTSMNLFSATADDDDLLIVDWELEFPSLLLQCYFNWAKKINLHF